MGAAGARWRGTAPKSIPTGDARAAAGKRLRGMRGGRGWSPGRLDDLFLGQLLHELAAEAGGVVGLADLVVVGDAAELVV